MHEFSSNYICSSLDAMLKKQNDEIIEWHCIHDLSFLNDNSINDEISEHYHSLIYQTLDEIIYIIEKLDHHTIFHKQDLKNAFRKISINSLDYFLFLFKWNNQIYIDIFLSFDMTTSSFIFNIFAEALHWILNHNHGIEMIHYLDDFLLFNCLNKFIFSTICFILGFEKKISKSLDEYIIDFIDIELDIDKLEIRLSKDKHDRAIKVVSKVFFNDKMFHKSLKNLLDYLSFCACVILLKCVFLRNLFDFLSVLAMNLYASRSFLKLTILNLRW